MLGEVYYADDILDATIGGGPKKSVPIFRNAFTDI